MLRFAALICLFFANTARAQESPDLAYLCDEKNSRVYFTSFSEVDEIESQRKASQPIEEIKAWQLITITKEDERGNVFRTGTRTLIKRCGEFTVRISGGFLNSNPQGELGAIEFPVVQLSFVGKLMLGRTALFVCDSSLSRFNAWAPCPASWATIIRAGSNNAQQRELTRARAWVYLKRSYEELRSVP